MSERLTYVWRLVVTLPDGSDAPGWRPNDFEDAYGWYERNPERQFSWPRRRLYLSSASACKRAHLMRRWGATVVVERSLRVEGWEAIYG